MKEPVYRVRVVLEKFSPVFEGQHPWYWNVERLRTVSISEATELRDAFAQHSTIVDALTLGHINPPLGHGRPPDVPYGEKSGINE